MSMSKGFDTRYRHELGYGLQAYGNAGEASPITPIWSGIGCRALTGPLLSACVVTSNYVDGRPTS